MEFLGTKFQYNVEYFCQYNARDSSVKIVFEPQPRPKAIATLTEKTIVKVACGNNHTGWYLSGWYFTRIP